MVNIINGGKAFVKFETEEALLAAMDIQEPNIGGRNLMIERARSNGRPQRSFDRQDRF